MLNVGIIYCLLPLILLDFLDKILFFLHKWKHKKGWTVVLWKPNFSFLSRIHVKCRNFDAKILWNRVRRVKNFGASKILARQKLWRVKIFGASKTLARQKLWRVKNFGASTIWRVNNMARQQYGASKIRRVRRVKNFGASKILARQKFSASKI